MSCDEGRHVVSNFIPYYVHVMYFMPYYFHFMYFIPDYVHITLNFTTHVQFHAHESRSAFNQNQVCSRHILFWSSSLYCDDKNIYGTHVTIYLERENDKVLGLIGPMGKMGCLSTFMVHLGLVGMRVVLTSYCDLPLVWWLFFYGFYFWTIGTLS